MIAVAVPAHLRPSTLRALRTTMRDEPVLTSAGTPVRLVSDAVAALTTLRAGPGLPAQGVVVLLDFGGGGTSITLADAAGAFEPIDDTTRSGEFSGDLVDQALLSHLLDDIATTGEVDPAGTAAVDSLTRLREDCRDAKERLSTVEATELVVALPGYRSAIRVTRAELERLIAEPLAGVASTLDMLLQRNDIGWERVSAVAAVGGGAAIPLVGRRLAEHAGMAVVTTAQPALAAAIGAGLLAADGAAAAAQTGLAPVAPVDLDESGSSTFRALAWSLDDAAVDEPVPLTEAYEPYAHDVASTRSPVQYVPATGPPTNRAPGNGYPGWSSAWRRSSRCSPSAVSRLC